MGYDHPVVFYVVAIVAVVVLAVGVYARVTIWRQGKAPAWHSEPSRGAFARALGSRVLLQSELRRRSLVRWAMHMAIFWGFVLLFVESLWLMVLAWLVPAESGLAQYFEGAGGQALLNLWGDVWGVVLLVGLVVALVRRYVLHVPQLETLTDDALALWALLAVSLTGFAAEGVRLAGGGQPAAEWAFAGAAFTWVADLPGVDGPMSLFWVHGLASLAFIAYIPYSKLVHMLTAPIEISLAAATAHERREAI